MSWIDSYGSGKCGLASRSVRYSVIFVRGSKYLIPSKIYTDHEGEVGGRGVAYSPGLRRQLVSGHLLRRLASKRLLTRWPQKQAPQGLC